MALPLIANGPSPSPADQADLDAMLCTAAQAAEAAGRYLRAHARGPVEFRGKDDAGDVVSELDLGAERLIVHRLREAYPEIPVLAEESGLAEAADGAHSPWLWLVDPLDGTNNLAIGLPTYVVGVALCQSGTPVASAVHEPETGRTWQARRGGPLIGPDGGPITRMPHSSTDRRQPVVAWTQGYRVANTDPDVGAMKAVLERNARRVLQLWAPLLAWTMLARGDIDAFVGYRPELIDLAGGVLLAQAAGLEMTTLSGNAFEARLDQHFVPDTDLSFICARPELMPLLLESVRQARELAPALTRVFES